MEPTEPWVRYSITRRWEGGRGRRRKPCDGSHFASSEGPASPDSTEVDPRPASARPARPVAGGAACRQRRDSDRHPQWRRPARRGRPVRVAPPCVRRVSPRPASARAPADCGEPASPGQRGSSTAAAASR
ncbi:hypothetical protein NL676_032151 [Syzygium grande]|nr:hypothetical protein NL676_032151 [Syzygium grande]